MGVSSCPRNLTDSLYAMDHQTRLSQALAYAQAVHAGVMRKGTDIPYLAHVVGVSVIVMETGGTEDEAIAGLLHDTLEDGGDPDRIRAELTALFGARVLEIVEAMSDATPEAGEAKPPWRARKESYIAHLRACDDTGVHRVCMADKLYNLRAINDDLDEIGDALWQRFNAPPEEQLWYFRALGDAFADGPLAATRLRAAYASELRRLGLRPGDEGCPGFGNEPR
jgi:(p)ppGpp synthase/HD superfamily hydrolase